MDWVVCIIDDALAGRCLLHERQITPIPQYLEKSIMSKEQKSNKEDKKKPALSPKEKKAAKKSKKDSKD